MVKDKGLVLDANILVRAVLGKRVGIILQGHHHHAKFFSPEICCAEALEHLPAILKKRGINPSHAMETLDRLPTLVQIVQSDVLSQPREDGAQPNSISRRGRLAGSCAGAVVECPDLDRRSRFVRCGDRYLDNRPD